MIKSFFSELETWWRSFCLIAPGRIGMHLRHRHLYKNLKSSGSGLFVLKGTWWNGMKNISIGNNVSIGLGCIFESNEGVIEIGNNTSFNSNVTLGSDFGVIHIGSDVIVGMNTVMRAANHRFDQAASIPIRKQGHEGGEIKIEDDVWIGANVTILSGVRVGSHSVVGAGSVVIDNVPSGVVVAGVPARILRKIK